MQIQRPGKMIIDALWAGDDIEYRYNQVKGRQEIWHRCGRGDREWVLFDAIPSRTIKENFIGPVQFVPAILGVLLDNAWGYNGNPAPVAGNFVPANEIGGGLSLHGLGANIDDWVAMHTGDNYPVTIAQSPRFHLITAIVDTEDVYLLAGLVGVANLETGNGAAWTVPDDGIWVEYDEPTALVKSFVTRRDGVSTITNIGVPYVGHSSFCMGVNDAGDEAALIFNGTKVAIHTTNLPTAQLKPLAMIGSRTAVAKDLHLHDFRLIFDHGIVF